MYPILWRYGTLILYSYHAMLGLGVVLATGWLARKYKYTLWLDGWLWGVGFGLIGGRVGFVWAEADYFASHTPEAWRLWEGGLSYTGVVMGGLVGWLGWSAWQQKNKQSFLSPYLFTPALALVHSFGWLACCLEGCTWGRLVQLDDPLAFLAMNLPDSYGVFDLRLHVQGVGVAVYLLLFIWFAWRDKPLNPSWLLLPHLLLLPLRGDISDLRVSLTLGFGGMVLTAVLLKYTDTHLVRSREKDTL